MIRNKRGDEDMLRMTIAFVVIVLIFVLGIWYYASHLKASKSVYEEFYAKKIALMIDSARPGTEFTIEFDIDKIKDKSLIRFINGYVEVSIGEEKGGYRYFYFNDVRIEPEYINVAKSPQEISFEILENE